jgi:hypothetical protein
MDNYPSIHQAYGGFMEQESEDQTIEMMKPKLDSRPPESRVISEEQMKINEKDLPTDASHSDCSIKIKCPKCHKVGETQMQSELGTAAWVWCVLLAPYICTGLICLCI